MSKDKKDVMKEMLGCGCCVDDRKILQGRITELEETIKALRQQAEVDFQVKKGLDEKLDKVTDDYKVLWVQHQNLKSVNKTLLHENNILNNAKTNQGLQSKVAKQANEIKRLTEELSVARGLARKYNSDNDELHEAISNKDLAIKTIAEDNKTLRIALDQTAKDAEDSFKHGKLKGAEELWAALREAHEGRPMGDNQKIFGYYTVGEILQNLSPTRFMTKHDEYKEKEAHDIKIGDEVVVISPLGSDDSDYGIVYNIIEQTNGSKSYHIIGSGNCMAFGDRAITDGSVRKTGKHYNHIPFDYIV